MAIAVITEYSQSGYDASNIRLAIGFEPYVAEQKLTFTTHVESAAFNEKTRMVRIIANAICFYKIGPDPVADSNCKWLPAHLPEYVGVKRGHKISVYDGVS